MTLGRARPGVARAVQSAAVVTASNASAAPQRSASTPAPAGSPSPTGPTRARPACPGRPRCQHDQPAAGRATTGTRRPSIREARAEHSTPQARATPSTPHSARPAISPTAESAPQSGRARQAPRGPPLPPPRPWRRRAAAPGRRGGGQAGAWQRGAEHEADVCAREDHRPLPGAPARDQRDREQRQRRAPLGHPVRRDPVRERRARGPVEQRADHARGQRQDVAGLEPGAHRLGRACNTPPGTHVRQALGGRGAQFDVPANPEALPATSW